jgi:hypothetical protein
MPDKKPHIRRVPLRSVDYWVWGYFLSRDARRPVIMSSNLRMVIYRAAYRSKKWESKK